MRFCLKNRDISPLECRISFSKIQNEKLLIQKSIGSFQAQFWVKLCVFFLIFCHISLDFDFEAYIRLIFRNFMAFPLHNRIST